MKKPKVVYITAQAFSGSTFFCALLGIHPDMEPVSELSKWTTKYAKPNRYCACGKRDAECEFWIEIETKWLGRIGSDRIMRYAQLQEKFETISSLWTINWAKVTKESRDFYEFEEMTVSLFKVISKISGSSVIIDSSKMPGRAFVLSKMEGIDLSIIHLVRNSLRYLESSLNRGKKISLSDSNLLYKTFRLGGRWSTTNYSAERAMKLSNVKGLRIRYEDLVSNPLRTLDSISAALEIDVSDIKTHLQNELPVSFQHMASGSGYRNRGAKPMTSEYAAVSEIDRRLKFAFYLGAALISRRYGYL